MNANKGETIVLTMALVIQGVSAWAQPADPRIATLQPQATPPANTEPGSPKRSEQNRKYTLNFRNASLETVLNYFSETGGLIIVLQAQASGNVDVWSDEALTKTQAIDVLDAVLEPKGLAAILNGRTLSIMNRDAARTRNLPVKFGSDPEQIPSTERLVTQIVPVRFVEVAQLLKDLQPLIGSQVTMIANESGNSIVITDSQAHIHRLAEITRALDSAAQDFTIVRVFKLQNSDPSEMADLLTGLFPNQSRSDSNSQSAPQFGGPFGGFRGPSGGGPGGPGLGGPAAQSNSTGDVANQRLKNRSQVIAVADPRTASLVVSATENLMRQIEQIIAELDANPHGKQFVQIYEMRNASPRELSQVLQDIFQRNTPANRNSLTQTDPLQTRISTQSQQSTSSTRTGAGQNGSTALGGGGQGGAAPSFQ